MIVILCLAKNIIKVGFSLCASTIDFKPKQKYTFKKEPKNIALKTKRLTNSTKTM